MPDPFLILLVFLIGTASLFVRVTWKPTRLPPSATKDFRDWARVFDKTYKEIWLVAGIGFILIGLLMSIAFLDSYL